MKRKQTTTAQGPDATRERAVEFTDRARETLGERLRSALLYGSVARGEAVVGVSDVNLLLLVDRVDGSLLRALGPAAREWAEGGAGAPPQVMDEGDWRRARDAFAIELADMLDAHETLHGADPLDGVTIDRAAMRLQAERELRVRLLGLHQSMLVTARHPEEVGRLMLASLPSITTYLRSALRLARRPVPTDFAGVARAGGELVGASPASMLDLLTARGKGEAPALEVDDATVAGYHQLVENTVEWIDRFREEGTR